MTHSLRLTLGPSLGMVLAIATASAGIALINRFVPIPNIMMLYVLALLYTATRWGRWSAMTASVLAFFSYDFLFVQPNYTLTISDPEEWLALAIFLSVAFVTSSLSERLSRAAQQPAGMQLAAVDGGATAPYGMGQLVGSSAIGDPGGGAMQYRRAAGPSALRRIILATDGSERARRAESFVGQLVPPGRRCEIELVYVYAQLAPPDYRPDPDRPWTLGRDRLPAYVTSVADSIFEAAEARVQETLPELADVSFWRRLVSSNDVAGTIVHEAERSSAELIVLGGREHGVLGLLGEGICREVVRRTKRPVVLVP